MHVDDLSLLRWTNSYDEIGAKSALQRPQSQTVALFYSLYQE
jgi:hypothetical protein